MNRSIAEKMRQRALRWQIPACIGVVLLLTAYAFVAAGMAAGALQ